MFLSIDNLVDPAPGAIPDDLGDECDTSSGSARAAAERIPFNRVVKQSDTYNAAVRKAFELSGSLKVFKLDEDLQSVRDRDVFVYIGEKSKSVGKALQDSVDITVMSGLELRRSIKATN